MKYLKFLVLVLVGCSNPTVNNETVYEQPVEIDTTKALQNENAIKKEASAKRISQKEVLLNEAVSISSDFYNNLKVQNYSGATKYLHPDALSVTPVNQWIEIYRKAQAKTGALGFVKMVDHAARLNMKSSNGIGDYAEFIFDAQYKDGNLREKLTFYRKDSTEAVKILAYEYNQIADQIFLSEEFRKKE